MKQVVKTTPAAHPDPATVQYMAVWAWCKGGLRKMSEESAWTHDGKNLKDPGHVECYPGSEIPVRAYPIIAGMDLTANCCWCGEYISTHMDHPGWAHWVPDPVKGKPMRMRQVACY